MEHVSIVSRESVRMLAKNLKRLAYLLYNDYGIEYRYFIVHINTIFYFFLYFSTKHIIFKILWKIFDILFLLLHVFLYLLLLLLLL